VRSLSPDRLQLAVLYYDERCQRLARTILSSNPGLSDSEFETQYWTAACTSFNAMIHRVALQFDEPTLEELHRLLMRAVLRYLVDHEVWVLLRRPH
jgi:hypothetical protein